MATLEKNAEKKLFNLNLNKVLKTWVDDDIDLNYLYDIVSQYKIINNDFNKKDLIIMRLTSELLKIKEG